MKKNTILSIETSCDETSIAIICNGTEVLSLEIATSIALHQATKGIIPEEAARAQVDFLNSVFNEALKKSGKKIEEIDAIAVTNGPGLIGSLMAGITFANTLSYLYKIPLLGVNHIYGHIFSNLLERNPDEIKFPAIVLTVSGGHNEIHLMKNFNEIELIGESLDDSAGEAFDKCGRMLGLGYPAGKEVGELAEKGDKKAFDFPRGMVQSGDFNFSFSGLKTSVLYKIQNIFEGKIFYDGKKNFFNEGENFSENSEKFLVKNGKDFEFFGEIGEQLRCDLAASFQEAICDILMKKTLKAVEKFGAKQIHLAGGVSANLRLREMFGEKTDLEILWPKKMVYCTDNGAMIGAAGYFQDLEFIKRVEVDIG
ncbi:tRNA (adenosine(37)-N6)-threonylcarbamoyltransferase complex transferase subunit TsaD [Candidatus Gracilibacteria bacterium]|nr:tRNA (adenosine(37)-N6)-threonylcarbamoyltransferase complex transferase subunit TsaD [Candidatus Gracilibacteria bacterium]